MSNQPFKSFAALAAHVATEQHKADMDAAARLRRSRPLRTNRRKGAGPAVAKARQVVG